VKVALVGIAGAAGALTRYALAVAIGVRSFPWATLAINLTGSFVLGLLLTVGIERQWSETTIVPLAVGFLGAYTTFSTFSYETIKLLEDGDYRRATLYAVLSVGLALAATLTGMVAAGELLAARRSS
jgi:CrcB protein